MLHKKPQWFMSRFVRLCRHSLCAQVRSALCKRNPAVTLSMSCIWELPRGLFFRTGLSERLNKNTFISVSSIFTDFILFRMDFFYRQSWIWGWLKICVLSATFNRRHLYVGEAEEVCENADGVGHYVRICIDSEIRYLIFSNYDCCLTLQMPSQRENSALPTNYILFRD